MKECTKAYAMIFLTLALIVSSLVVVMMTQPAQASEIEPEWTWKVSPRDTTNVRALTELRLQQLDDKLKCIGETETARLEAEQAALEAEQAYYAESYYAPSYGGGIYYAPYSDAYNVDGPSHTMPGWYDGYLETYYSDTVSRHYMSDQWNVDSEGFYRDDQGRYIVGVDISEGIPLGTEVETGKGTAVVMDYGSGAHVHDFYVHGW